MHYDYYAKWEADGTTEVIHDELRRTVRKAAGRSAEPSAAILDAQSIRTSGNVPESSQGIDAGKKIKGRKRHIATDTFGLLLVLLVTAASVQDTTGGRDVVSELAARHPGVVRAWADSGYKRSVIERGAGHGIKVEVVSKDLVLDASYKQSLVTTRSLGRVGWRWRWASVSSSAIETTRLARSLSGP